MTIEVEEWYNDDGKLNLTITWDENDPVESKFNDWTPEDFLTVIRNACEQKLSVTYADGYSYREVNNYG